MKDFELDPRFHADRNENDEWEDVGALANLDLNAVFNALDREKGLKFGKDSHILEVGVGKARLFQQLKDDGFDVVGVEARARKEHHNLPIAHIRIEEMPFEKETATFDVVIACSVFDTEVYTQDQQRMLESIASALRPGGIFIYGYALDGDLPGRSDLRELKMPKPYEWLLVYQKV